MNRVLTLTLLLLVACDSSVDPDSAPQAPPVDTGPWTRYQKANADLRDARTDVEKRVEDARSRLIECHKSLAASAQAAAGPAPTALEAPGGKLPDAAVVAAAPVNTEGARFVNGPGKGAQSPCGASADDVKAIQDDLRKVMNTVAFTPKGARECNPDSGPHDAATSANCEEGIAFLTSVSGQVRALGKKLADSVPDKISSSAEVVATDRVFCEEATAGVQFTTRTIFAVTCSRSRHWVRVKDGMIVGSLTRVHKQPPVRPKDPDPTIAMLETAQSDTRTRAEAGVLSRLDRATGYPAKAR